MYTKDAISSLVDIPPRIKPRDSIWELTADAIGMLPDDYLVDAMMPGGHVYEVAAGDEWYVVHKDVFGSWVGPRRIDGEYYHGPIHNFGTTVLYTGARSCACTSCQSTVAPNLRMS